MRSATRPTRLGDRRTPALRAAPALLVALVMALAATLVAAPSARADPEDFSFSSWHTEITASFERGTVGGRVLRSDITETIVAEFPEHDQNRGIVRAIPVHAGHQTMRLENLEVTDEHGDPVEFERSQERGSSEVELAIGDDGFEHGPTTYVISYSLVNTVWSGDYSSSYAPDLVPEHRSQDIDEFSADVTVPTELVDAVRPVPDYADHEGLDGLDIACYRAEFAGSDQGCDVERADHGDETTFSIAPLDLGRQAITLDLTLDDDGTAAPSSLNALTPIQALALLALIVGALVSALAIVARVRGRRRLWSGPPADVRIRTDVPPVRAGILHRRGRVPDGPAFAASVLFSAMHGAVTLESEERGGDARSSSGGSARVTVRSTGDTSQLPEEQRAFLDEVLELRGEDDSARLHDGAYDLARRWKSFGHDLAVQMKERGELAPVRRFTAVPVTALLLLVVGAVAMLLTWLHVADDLFGGVVAAVLLGVAGVIGIGMCLSAGAVLRPARMAVEDAEELRGLERFMRLGAPERDAELRSAVAGDREAAHAAQERLLPYAVALGLEAEWSRPLTAWLEHAGIDARDSSSTSQFLSLLTTSAERTSSSSSGGSSGGGGGGGSAGGGFGGGSVGGR